MIQVSLNQVDDDNDGTIDGAFVDVWASDIDQGSYHSCGNEIVISLDSDTTINSVTYDCLNVGFNTIQLWVTDTNTGIQDFCLSTIEILNNDFCNELNMARIDGDIYTENNEFVEGVNVDLQGHIINDITEEDGNYAFDNIQMHNEYIVNPHKDDDYLNGVSTLDLILIQRHILGLAQITSPYKLLAADVNNDGSISAVDLVELRKLIIGVNSDFTYNTSWRFIDAGYEFPDPSSPNSEPLPEIYEIPELLGDMKIDFIGVKTGDVNSSVVANLDSKGIVSRNKSQSLDFILPQIDIYKGDIVTIPVTSINYNDILGWQGTLKYENEQVDVLGIIPNELHLIENVNYSLATNEYGYINFSSNVGEQLTLNEDEILFEIVIKANRNVNTSSLFKFDSALINQEAYNNYKEPIDLNIKTKDLRPAKIENVYPNPWIDNTKVEFFLPVADQVSFEFYDAKGSMIYSLENTYASGNHMFILERELFSKPGVVYIKMTTSKSVDQFKMVIIK